MKKQYGASMYSMLVFLPLLLFAIVFTVKVVPFYLDDAIVESVIKDVAQKAGANNMSRTDIQDAIKSHLQMNDLIRYADEIELDEKGQSDRLVMDYERRSHLISNIDIVAHFQHDVEIISE